MYVCVCVRVYAYISSHHNRNVWRIRQVNPHVRGVECLCIYIYTSIYISIYIGRYTCMNRKNDGSMVWPLHDTAITNIVKCLPYKRGVGRGPYIKRYYLWATYRGSDIKEVSRANNRTH